MTTPRNTCLLLISAVLASGVSACTATSSPAAPLATGFHPSSPTATATGSRTGTAWATPGAATQCTNMTLSGVSNHDETIQRVMVTRSVNGRMYPDTATDRVIAPLVIPTVSARVGQPPAIGDVLGALRAPDFGQRTPQQFDGRPGRGVTLSHPGRYLAYDGTRTISGDYAATCSGQPAAGTFRTIAPLGVV